MGLETATTIRSLLMRAWRERWSDIQWGIHLKKVLPRYISGDIYHLSECLLQQALMGRLPNQLILSYLRHSFSSGMVSYSGVMESISKFNSFHKSYCVHALLELMKVLMRHAYSRGKPEDCLTLATSILSGTHWLIKVMIHLVETIRDQSKSDAVYTNLKLANAVLEEIYQRPFLMCMLHLGSREENNMWSECRRSISIMEQLVSTGVDSSLERYVESMQRIRDDKAYLALHRNICYDSTVNSVCPAIYTIVMLEVIIHTTREAEILAKQLLLIKTFKGMSLTDLYLELFKSCFIGMGAEEIRPYQELKWVGFTYVKVPYIVHTIHKILHGDNAPTRSDELLHAVQLLSKMTTLLDVADYRVNCNCLEYLLKEFISKGNALSYDLLLERDAQAILAARMEDSQFLWELQTSESQGSNLGNPDLILRAQPTVVSILRTLSNKNSDSVLPVLSLLISGKSRELLLIAAASSGKLHIYAQKFVKLNEQSKEPMPDETTKSAMTRAVVFDISFLLLCHIAQIYGTSVVVSAECNTFVERWIIENIPEPGKTPKDNNTDVADSSLAILMKHLNSADVESKYTMCSWQTMCNGATNSIKEIVNMARHTAVPNQVVYELLAKQSQHLCSLAVCVASWICSFVQADGTSCKQAVEYLEFMHTKLVSESAQSSMLENYKDRCTMMCEIVSNMMAVVEGRNKPTHTPPITKDNDSDHQENLNERFLQMWSLFKENDIFITHDVLKESEELVRLGGPNWFVSSFVKVALEKTFAQKLSHSVDMLCSLFHLDIVQCTTSFLLHTLPNYLMGPLSAELKCEARTRGLAVLTAKLMISCWLHLQPLLAKAEIPVVRECRGVKRPWDSCECIAVDNLVERIPTITTGNLDASAITFLGAVNDLFRLMLQGSRWEAESPVTHLMVSTLRELASYPYASSLLTLLPLFTLNGFLPILPPSLSFNHHELLVLGAPQPIDKPLHGDLLLHAHSKTKLMRQNTAKLLCIKRNLQLAWSED